MIKLEAIMQFDYKDFDKLENLVRKNETNNNKGRLYAGDTFTCNKEMSEYLTGKNDIKLVACRVIEIIPEIVEEIKKEVKEEKKEKKTTKKTTKKK